MAFARLLAATLRLHSRNRLAVAYGQLVPAIFLLAYYGLYAHERFPLARHLGELLTITALSGACFALPTTLVRERERGVWRRYRLAPGSFAPVVSATLLAHLALLCLSGAGQLAIALALGTPLPSHPFQLAAAFALVALVLLSVGLVLSALANTVHAAQALGQCVFLPMLMVGGVAVRIEALPGWARSLSAYLPGRYAVEVIQACVTGAGLSGMGLQLAALCGLGAAALAAGVAMLRAAGADSRVPRAARASAAAALATWMVVGYLATTRGPYAPAAPRTASARVDPAAGGEPRGRGGATVAPAGERPGRDGTTKATETAGAGVPAPGGQSPPSEGTAPAALREIDRDVDYSRLPPDDGLVAPIARPGELPPDEVADQLECMRMMIPGWGPARVADPVQRVRNYLYVAAVPDVYQTGELERWIPLVVAERLRREFDRDELVRILHQIATHPEEGDLSAAGELRGVCFERGAPSDQAQLRERVTFYALKLLGRETGRLPGHGPL